MRLGKSNGLEILWLPVLFRNYVVKNVASPRDIATLFLRNLSYIRDLLDVISPTCNIRHFQRSRHRYFTVDNNGVSPGTGSPLSTTPTSTDDGSADSENRHVHKSM